MGNMKPWPFELSNILAAAAKDHQLEIADLLVAYLQIIGVEYVFGVPGGAIEPLFNALARSERRGGPRAVVARHEAGAAFMADGYARETGKLGVCCATSGPGATNLITGVACAHDNGMPVLAITGQPALPSFGKRALQESACTGINTLGMFRHCTRFNSLVSHPEQAEPKLITAIVKAMRSRGAAHLTYPVDVLRTPLDAQHHITDINALIRKRGLLDDEAVREAAQLLKQTGRVVFMIGGGCADSMPQIMKLVELLDAQFVSTPDGKGLVNPSHHAYYGVFGFAGHTSAAALLAGNPDLVVVLGTNLGEWTSGAWSSLVLNNRLIHIDSSDDHLMRSPMARLHVRGRIFTVCERLIELLQPVCYARANKIDAQLDPERFMAEPDKYESDATPIKPQRLMRELTRRFPASTRFVADAGNSTAWAVHYLTHDDRRVQTLERRQSREERRTEAQSDRRSENANWLRVIMDFAPMGWAIGAAVGIAQGQPECPVVCLTGDGSYLMSGQEITVAAEQGLTVIFVILNDAAYGMVKHGQRLAGAESIGWQLPKADYRKLAESLGVPGHVIESPDDFDKIDFDAILNRKGPTLLDIRIDGEEVPPMSLRMQTLGSVAEPKEGAA